MSKSVNRVFLMGHVGAEPEVRTTNKGTKVANLSLATNEVWYDRNDQKQERTDWHRCVAWEKVADLIEQYVHKGDRLYVEGRISYSQTEDDKGNVKYWTDIVIRDIVLMGSPAGGGGSRDEGRRQPSGAGKRRPAPAGSKPKGNPFTDDDELPF